MEFSTAAKCTVAILATMLGCTYWLTSTIERVAPTGTEYYEKFATLHSDLDAIDHTVSAVVSNTDSIDRRRMPPEERVRDFTRRMQNLQKKQ
jgi:hypothetical protein